MRSKTSALDLGDVGQQAHHVAGEAVLVVVPGDELHEVAVQGVASIENARFFPSSASLFYQVFGAKNMNSYRTRRDNIFRTKLYTVSCSGYKPFDLFCTSLFTSFIVNSQDLCRLSKLDPLYLIQTRFLEMQTERQIQICEEQI